MNTLIEELSQFTGTEQYYKYSFFNQTVNLTDGIKYLAETTKCYWLINAILSHQYNKKVKAEPFQIWKLEKINDIWTLSCEDGDSNLKYLIAIQYSDFPLGAIEIWYVDNVLLLPSEY